MTDITPDQIPTSNPLAKYFRVPGLDVPLPTGGRFFPEGSADLQEDGSVSVLPMRAADELLLKHPDMLLSGHAIENLLKSCVPAIKNPGLISTPDLDVLLLAIRAATYGDNMEVQANCPKCDRENAFDAHLPSILQQAKPITAEDGIVRLTDDVVAYVRPYNFRDATRLSLTTFTETRKVQNAEDTKETPEARVKQMNASMEALTQLSVSIMTDCVIRIVTPDGAVENREHIQEFMGSIARDWTAKIEESLQELNSRGIDKSVSATCQACGHEWMTSIEFDPSSFFG